MKVAVFGAGYWSHFQIAAWQSLGVEVTAIWNRTKSKAEDAAKKFNIKYVYDDKEELFKNCDFDICDIITDVCAHYEITELSVKYKKPVICQKPMASAYDACVKMQRMCDENGIWNAVHENFRYQPQFIKAKELLDSHVIGKILRAAVQLKSPDRKIIRVQPALGMMDHMALRDMGPHIFDIIRYLFGEIKEIYSKAITEYKDINVDDSAVSLLTSMDDVVISCNLVHDFEYKAYIIGENGRMVIHKDNKIQIIQDDNEKFFDTKTVEKLPYIPDYDWEVHGGHVFAAIPKCLEMMIDTFNKGIPAVTSMADNLKTMQLVFAAIKSQDENRAVNLNEIEY
ncbi:MAG: Gfo/Idh/MocA family protein [Eubacteriales bacterium]